MGENGGEAPSRKPVAKDEIPPFPARRPSVAPILVQLRPRRQRNAPSNRPVRSEREFRYSFRRSLLVAGHMVVGPPR